MKKNEIRKILINEYGYLENQINDLSKEKLLDILNIERKRKSKSTNFISDFWIIKGIPRPKVIAEDGLENTEKYAWWIFAAWLGSFIFFGLFIFLMIYFFA